MNLYDRYCLPHLVHIVCSGDTVARQREKVVPLAEGRVLEVGMGSGLNLPFYDRDRVELVLGLEPSDMMRRKAQRNIQRAPFDVRLLDLPGEEIPLDDDSVDTVLLTYTLCTIPDWQIALEQMRRVLRPGGRLIFCEHGTAPDAAVRKWQDRLNPFWKKLAGGCHLNRPIPRLIEAGGFRVENLDSGYIPGPKFAAFNYWGTARQA